MVSKPIGGGGPGAKVPYVQMIVDGIAVSNCWGAKKIGRTVPPSIGGGTATAGHARIQVTFGSTCGGTGGKGRTVCPMTSGVTTVSHTRVQVTFGSTCGGMGGNGLTVVPVM